LCNPAGQPATFFVPRQGYPVQQVDDDQKTTLLRSGAGQYASVEVAGPAPLTVEQLDALAAIFVEGHHRYGWPLALAEHAGDRGLLCHGAGGLVAFGGHPECPGPSIAGQRLAILERARSRLAEPTATLSGGAFGPAVALLQRHLMVPPTGLFDEATEAAVRGFQRSKGLLADGVVGPKTVGALNATASDRASLAPSTKALAGGGDTSLAEGNVPDAPVPGSLPGLGPAATSGEHPPSAESDQPLATESPPQDAAPADSPSEPAGDGSTATSPEVTGSDVVENTERPAPGTRTETGPGHVSLSAPSGTLFPGAFYDFSITATRGWEWDDADSHQPVPVYPQDVYLQTDETTGMDGGKFPATLVDPNDLQRWSATAQFSTEGSGQPATHQVEAFATYVLGSPEQVNSGPTSLRVGPPSVPTFTLLSPPAVSSLPYTVEVQVSNASGVTAVEYCSFASPISTPEGEIPPADATWQPLSSANGRTWSAQTSLAADLPVPPAGGRSFIGVRNKDNLGETSAPFVFPALTLVDKTPPVLSVAQPSDGSIVEVPGGDPASGSPSISVVVVAILTDPGPPAVTSGIANTGAVTCAVDQNSPTALDQTQNAGATEWRATVTITGAGTHTLTFNATDKAGNRATAQNRTIVLRVGPPLDRTDMGYLEDLVKFINRRVMTAAGSSPGVTGTDLETTFGQPFMSLPTAPGPATDQINAVRGAVEVLRNFLGSSAAGIGNGYPAAAYQAVLVALRTSAEELRVARGASPATRAALAARLGVSLPGARPDQLDQLLLSSAQVSEASLQMLFGLQPTTTDPLAPAPAPAMFLTWQQQALRSAWAFSDYATTRPNDYTAPIVDPDIVTSDDLLPASQGGTAAIDLWQARRGWAQDQVKSLQQLRQPEVPASAALRAVCAKVLSGFDINATATKQYNGTDISAILGAIPLDLAGFSRLATLVNLASGGLTDDEWDDAYNILVQVEKRRQFPSWRSEERLAGLLLDPRWFQPADVTAAQLSPWRAPWPARLAWENKLAGRTAQLSGLARSLTSSLASAEQVALPPLRDSLLDQAAQVQPNDTAAQVGTKREALCHQLCTDLLVGPQLTTTRLNRAVESLQALLDAVDPGGELASLGLPWVVPVPTQYASIGLDAFFGELNWMRDFASWQSAMNVFVYPENHLLPGTIPSEAAANSSVDNTGSFSKWITRLTGSPLGLNSDDARAEARSYWNSLTSELGGDSDPVVTKFLHDLPIKDTHTGGQVYPLDERLGRDDLVSLQSLESNLFGNYTSLAGVPAAIMEAFFHVPMQIALSLAQNQQWEEALHWLHTIYDPTMPAGQKTVFGGFALESQPAHVTRNEYWLNGGSLDPHALALSRSNCYLRFTLMTTAETLCDWADSCFGQDTAESRAEARGLYAQALEVLADPGLSAEGPVLDYSTDKTNPEVPQNDHVTNLQLRANGNLQKLRAGLNIAGLARPLGGASGDGTRPGVPPPTNYHYTTLVARAQRLVASSTQVEGTYLARLLATDNETYNRMVAQQDLRVASAHVTVAQDQVTAATENQRVAQLQVQKAQTQSSTYQSWITRGLDDGERAMLGDYKNVRNNQQWATNTRTSVAAASGFRGCMERQMTRWQLGKWLADYDVQIGAQQVAIATAQAQIANDQAAVAKTTQNNARQRVNFLTTKFTSAQLSSWMSHVLGHVYRYLLQQAAAVARLAEQQLAFEQQSPASGLIKSDYWSDAAVPAGANAPARSGSPVGNTGVTGSERLLEDITQLDQYVVQTNRRKLQLTQTYSVATMAPLDLERFRQSGILPISVPLSHWGMPGIYLATIRQVRVSIAAPVPPAQGIRGLLTSGGASHILVNNGGGFQAVTLARAPQTIVLTSPAAAGARFNVDLQPDVLLPFEGCGLDVSLTLELPQAVNGFDFRTIADVQLSVDYTALYSDDYATQVIRSWPTQVSNVISFSLRDFADSWYQLLAQAQSASPPRVLVAQYRLSADDFPPNLSNLQLQQLALMAIEGNGGTEELTIDHLSLNGRPAPAAKTTHAVTAQGIVSTLNGSGASWREQLLGNQWSPVGTWELGLIADPATLASLRNGRVQDLVLVITYSGTVPPWPS
jgi:peptidoglycan hydrolase-like protein with peptidoglycan-binding domain